MSSLIKESQYQRKQKGVVFLTLCQIMHQHEETNKFLLSLLNRYCSGYLSAKGAALYPNACFIGRLLSVSISDPLSVVTSLSSSM